MTEYNILRFSVSASKDFSWAGVIDALNDAASKGWRIVNMTEHDYAWTFLLERQKEGTYR